MENQPLELLIREYQARVQEAISLFLTHKNIHPIHWRQELPRSGYLDPAKTIHYAFHGIGCYVELPSGPIDWDFGYNGRSDGFDQWRLSEFALEGTTNFPEFRDDETLEAAFAEAIEDGLIQKLHQDRRDRLYYLTAKTNPIGQGNELPS